MMEEAPHAKCLPSPNVGDRTPHNMNSVDEDICTRRPILLPRSLAADKNGACLQEQAGSNSHLIRDVFWHLVNLCAVVLFNCPQFVRIPASSEVDGDTFPPESTAAANAMQVAFHV